MCELPCHVAGRAHGVVLYFLLLLCHAYISRPCRTFCLKNLLSCCSWHLLTYHQRRISQWLRLVPHGMCNCWRHCRIRVIMLRLSWRVRSQYFCSVLPAMQQHNPHPLAPWQVAALLHSGQLARRIWPTGKQSKPDTAAKTNTVHPMIGHLPSTAPGVEAPDV